MFQNTVSLPEDWGSIYLRKWKKGILEHDKTASSQNLSNQLFIIIYPLPERCGETEAQRTTSFAHEREES